MVDILRKAVGKGPVRGEEVGTLGDIFRKAVWKGPGVGEVVDSLGTSLGGRTQYLESGEELDRLGTSLGRQVGRAQVLER